MPRPRNNDHSQIVTPIVNEFASQLATVIERFTSERIAAATRAQRSVAVARKSRQPGGSRKKLCYVPGCRNLAAPRFGMFCAAKHKGLPVSAKNRYRAAHAAAQA